MAQLASILDADFTDEGTEAWATPDDYEIVRKIGRGRRAEVFHAVRNIDLQAYAIKIFKPANNTRAQNEVRMLRELQECPHIISLMGMVKDDQALKISLVFELIDHTDHRSLFPKLSSIEIRLYFKQLIQALAFTHKNCIMHRNVRPLNLVIDHGRKQLKLIGWGSSAPYTPGTSYEVAVGSAFKPPELLLSFQEYDYSLDMWSVGDMLASVIFRKEPFFHGNSTLDQLDRVARVLGTGDLLNWVEKYDMEAPDVDQVGVYDKRPWGSFVDEGNRHRADAHAMDLVDKLLRWDHGDRLTAEAALGHSFFALAEGSNDGD